MSAQPSYLLWLRTILAATKWLIKLQDIRLITLPTHFVKMKCCFYVMLSSLFRVILTRTKSSYQRHFPHDCVKYASQQFDRYNKFIRTNWSYRLYFKRTRTLIGLLQSRRHDNVAKVNENIIGSNEDFLT